MHSKTKQDFVKQQHVANVAIKNVEVFSRLIPGNLFLDCCRAAICFYVTTYREISGASLISELAHRLFLDSNDNMMLQAKKLSEIESPRLIFSDFNFLTAAFGYLHLNMSKSLLIRWDLMDNSKAAILSDGRVFYPVLAANDDSERILLPSVGANVFNVIAETFASIVVNNRKQYKQDKLQRIASNFVAEYESALACFSNVEPNFPDYLQESIELFQKAVPNLHLQTLLSMTRKKP